MNLSKINLKNWGPFRGEHNILIPEGLVRVTGQNRDRQGAISNRSGKTSLLNSIVAAYSGRTPLVSTGSKFINDKEKSASIIITFDTKDTLTRYFKDTKFGNSVTFGKEPNLISGQEAVETMFGMNFEAFVATIFFGTNYSDFLEKILRKPIEAKDLLTSLIPNLGIFDKALEWIKENLDIIYRKKEGVEKEINRTNGILQGLESMDYLVEISKWDVDNKRKIDSCKQSIKSLEEELKGLPTGDYTELQRKHEDLIRAKDVFSNKKTQFEKSIFNCKQQKINFDREILSLKRSLDSIKEGICPTCGQKISKKELKEQYEEKLKTQEKLKADTEQEKGKLEKDLIKLHPLLEEKDKELKLIREEMGLFSAVSSAKAKLATFQNTLSNLIKETNPWIAEKKKKEELSSSYKRRIEEFQTEVKKLTDLAQYYQYWVVGYGSRGIKNFVFDEIIFRLTDKAQEYLDFMTEGSIQIRFDPRKQKKSGGFVETIGLEISSDSDSRDFFTWSQSERKKVSLATSLAMNNLLREMFNIKLNFLVFDETFDGLDEVGISLFCNLLRSLLAEIKTILVVSHNPFSMDLFDDTLTVIKENGESKVAKVTTEKALQTIRRRVR